MPQYKKQLKRGDRWFYKFSYQGRIFRSNAVYLTKQDARKAEIKELNEAENEIKVSSEHTNNDILLLDLINQRLDYLQAAKTKKYYTENKRFFKILFEYLGNIQVVDVRKADIQRLLIEESKSQKMKNNDNYIVNAMLRSFKSMFNYGILILDIKVTNPCLGLEFFSIEKKMKYIPTETEINTVLANCSKDQKRLLEFVRDTGCRISEALNLRRKDVFDGYVILHTRKSKSGNLMPREAKYDISKIFLSEVLEDKIFAQWSEEPKFLSRKTLGKWNWHNLRHKYASLLSKNNTPIFEIMSRLGHSNIKTTQHYLQLLP